jgi:hypothetical protein
MASPEKLSQPRKQVSIERGGLGQSGYTAGRKEGDVALDDAIDTRYPAPPGSAADGLGLDDRFTGRGGPVRDVERDGPGEAVADDPLDRSERSERTDRAGERVDDRRA